MVTARLEGWYRASDNNVLWGFIYDDVRKRWEDGTNIHTSYIKDLASMELQEGDKVYTLNSTYLLGKPLFKKSS